MKEGGRRGEGEEGKRASPRLALAALATAVFADAADGAARRAEEGRGLGGGGRCAR